MIEDDRQIYGGGIVNATTGDGVFGEGGGHPVGYTVTFAHALTSFAFDRVQENAGPSGSSYAIWTATAYDAQGHALGTVGEGANFVFGSPIAAAHYVLTGADIAYVTFSGDDLGTLGFANVVTDSWVLTDAAVVPAATAAVWDNTSGDWNDTLSHGLTDTVDHWTGVVTPTSSDDVTINAAGSPYTVAIANNDFAFADSLHLDSTTATIDDSGSLNLAGNLVIDHGTFEMDGGSLQAASIQVASTGNFEGEGTINGPVSVSGVVEAIGTLDFAGYVTGTGTFNIESFATLEFGGPVSTGSVVSFANAAGQGTLHLDSPSTFQGQVTGLATGDVLDLGGLSAATNDHFHVSDAYNSATGTTLVTVTDENNSVSTSVTLAGDYSNVLWSAAADGHGNNGQQGVNLAMDKVTMTVSAGPYDALNSIDVQVNVIDGLTGQPADGVSVAPSFTSGAGQGAFTFLNSIFGDISPKETDPSGTADFSLNPFGYGGTYNISMVVGGTETLSQQVILPSLGGAGFTSALKAVVNFAGPQETATLTLLERDSFYTPVSGDPINWAGAGGFSPGSGAGVTDANGNLIDTFTPNVDTTQTVTATFGDQEHASTNVQFVTMDSWINTSGGIWNDAVNAGTNWSNGIPTSGEGVWIGSLGTYTVDVTATESIYGLGTLSTATLEIGNGSTFSVTGTGNSVIAGALTIDAGGEFVAQNGIVQLNGAVTNNHVLEAQSGATINIANNVGGTGGIVADGAFVNAAGSLASTQAITITGAGIVHLAQAEGGQVTFSGAGMLALDAAPAAGMTVHNFGIGDSLDLTHLAFSSSETLSWDVSTNTLTVHDGAASESITFGEGHSLSDFALTADPLGTGGTDIVYNNQSLNYTHAVSDTFLSLSGLNHFMGGINDAGIALVVGEVVNGNVGVSDNYFYVNGHLVSLPGSPLNQSFNVGEVFGGINNAQKIVLSFADNAGDQYAETYLGTFDSSTGLADGSGGAIAQFSGPSQLKTNLLVPAFLGEGLGINDNNVIVGFFTDATGLARQNQNGDQSHVFIINGPPGAGFNGNPQGNLEHEYGFIWSPSGGYTLINAGSSSNVVNSSNDPSPGVSYFGGATPTDGVAYTVLTDINNAGIAVGYYMDGQSVEHAFIFNTITHAFTFIPDQSYPGSNGQLTSTVATAINNEGIVVGYYGDAFATNAEVDPNNSVQSFVYDANTNQFLTTNFTLPGGGNVGLTGINDNGMVSGESGDNLFVASLQPIVTIDNGGTLYLTTGTSETIHFGGGTGELVLSAGFNGEITGFTGTGASASQSDVIDLVGINYVESANWNARFVAATGVLTVHENAGGTYALNLPGYTGGFAYTTDGHGGTLVFDPPAGPTTVADGELYEVTAASSDTITFAGSAGKLQLDNPASFTGHVAGFAGTAPDAAHSDVLDLAGIDFNSTKFAETYQSATGELTVTDGTNSAKFTLDNFNGTLGFASDGNGGTAITGVSSTLSTPQMAVVPVAVADPAAQPAASMIVPTAPNQTLTGNAVSDTFVFNFATVGQATVTNFHTATDTLQFNSQLFANVQAALNATQDDGHGNTVITLDAHDSITLSGVVKAQLHANDFHFA